MRAIFKALAAIGFAIVLLSRTVSPSFAQVNVTPITEECNDPTFAAANPDQCTLGSVGGETVTVLDIQNAINSPTPNLANTTAYIFYTISVIIKGTVSVNNPADGQQAYAAPTSLTQATEQSGAIGGIGYLMGEMIKNQPASTGSYIAYVGQNSRFIAGNQAYAQGIGFAALNPVLGTWAAFRDIAYYLLILMFFISGFLILIRHKISGQVAVTVQTILPRLVLTLILITFSYAIAGLVIDGMFLAIYFVINLFDGAIFHNNAQFALALNEPKNLTDLALNTNIFEFMIGYIFNDNASGSAWGAADALGTMVQQSIAAVVGESAVFGFFSDGGLFRGLITIVFTLIFGIALLIAMFRTFFALLMSYAGFIINVVMSPFILLPGVMPNNNAFGNWIKNLIAGVAPFVVAIFMIFMSLALTGGPETNQPGVGYRPTGTAERVEGLRLPLIMAGNIDASAFIGIIGMGFMLLLPEAVNITKELVGAKGGIFDKYKDKAVEAFNKGRKPGMRVARGIAGAPVGAAVGGVGAYVASRSGALGDDQKKNARRNALLGTVGGGIAGGYGVGNTLKLMRKPVNVMSGVNKNLKEVAEFGETASAALEAGTLGQRWQRVQDTWDQQAARQRRGPVPGVGPKGSGQSTPNTDVTNRRKAALDE